MRRCQSIVPAVAWLLVALAGCSSSSNSVNGAGAAGKPYPTGGATYVAAGGNTTASGNADAGVSSPDAAGPGSTRDAFAMGGASSAGGNITPTGGFIAMGGESAAGGATYGAGGATGFGGATHAPGGTPGLSGATAAAG